MDALDQILKADLLEQANTIAMWLGVGIMAIVMLVAIVHELSR